MNWGGWMRLLRGEVECDGLSERRKKTEFRLGRCLTISSLLDEF